MVSVLLTVTTIHLTLLFKITVYFRLTKLHGMRKTILILTFFLSAYDLYSQHDSLLKTFKYRVNHYREINFNIGGGTDADKREFGAGEYKSNASSGNLGASWYHIKSTDRILLTITGNAGFAFSSGKTKDPVREIKSRNFFGSSQFSVLNKWFRKNLFTEIGADLFGHNNANKYTPVNPTGSEKNKKNDYSIAIDLGIGKGRLENITDMQNALWLYKTLQEEKKLSRSLSNAELDELGHTITAGKNTRVLDFRKRTQFILGTTDHFFQQKGILTANDIRYFTSLNDILFFTINSQRLSGSEIYIRLTPGLINANRDNINNSLFTKQEDKIVSKSLLLSAGINKYIPANLRHQNNYGASLRLNYISYHEADKFFIAGSPASQFDFNTTLKQAGINLFFEHAIYPNTRTIISFDLQSEAGYMDAGQPSGLFGTANLAGSLNYFISYKTRLMCNLGAALQTKVYRYNDYQQLELMPDFIQIYANAGLLVTL